MEEELLSIKNAAMSFIVEAEDLQELEEIRVQFLGRNGKVNLAMKDIAKLPKEKRPELGQLANEVKHIIEETIVQKQSQLKSRVEKKRKEEIDFSQPGVEPRVGHLHPISHVLSEIVDIFKTLGFQAAGGPEIETDHYNFEALNIPKHHPSRDTQQTLFLDTAHTKYTPGELMLRTQTSNMQGRIMEQLKPPFRVIVPGKVYRYEQVDASHGFEFWQLEGFMVDRNVTMSDLFGTIEYFFKKFYGEDTKVKFVCHNFPFVEPGAESYMSCTVCKGRGCSFCKHSGWVEVLGAGMIHPHVLKTAGIDPRQWQGFAFGTGLSRMVTLKYHMDDLRLLSNPDLRILKQF